MPLLKGRFSTTAKPLLNVDPNETIYTIPHTSEQFRSKEEYLKRIKLYEEPIWTCQCTGQIKLSHEDAWDSERQVHKALKKEVPEYYWKPILELVHHSTLILDALTDLSWRKLMEYFCIGEPVALKVSDKGKIIKGEIVKMESKPDEEKSSDTSTSSSPSSNKENRKNNSDKTSEVKSPKKAPPKIKPLKYSVKLEGQDKIIHDIPATDLKRQDKTPGKDTVKLFIRSNAWRGGFLFNSPWAVREDLVKKYSLPSKYAEFLVSPTKMRELGDKALEESLKNVKISKRKLSQSPPTARKKIKLDSKQSTLTSKQSTLASKKSKASPKKPGSPKKTKQSPLKTNGKALQSPSPEKRSRGRPRLSLEEKLARQKARKEGTLPIQKRSSKKDSLKQTTLTSPKKRSRSKKDEGSKSPKKSPTKKRPNSVIELDSSSDDEVSLATLKSKNDNDNLSLAQLKKKLTEKNKASKKKRSGDKEKGSPKKKLKQMTLFDMKSKKNCQSPRKPPVKSPKSPKKIPYKIPPIAARLQKSMKDGNKPQYHQFLSRCVRELSLAQIKKLPQDVKEVVMKKHDKMEETKRLNNMSPKEKEEYLKAKKKEALKRYKEVMKQKNKRCEDSHLDLKPLPSIKLVPTPEGLPNELFGDVAMVIEFINSYKGLLIPESKEVFKAEALMKALTSGSSGIQFLGNIFSVLLQTLFQDEIAKDYKELFTPLCNIPVNQYTVSELVRLCLRRTDAYTSDSDVHSDASDDDIETDDDVPEYLVELLETTEMSEMKPEEKLQILVGVCHRLMGSYSVQDYMDDRQQEASSLWKKKIALLKEKNDQRKVAKQNKIAEKQVEKTEKTNGEKKEVQVEAKEATVENKGMTIDKFYSHQEETAADDGSDDLVSVVKRRRQLAAKAAQEKEMREKVEKIRREKEYEELRKEKQAEMFEKEFSDGLILAKMACRLTPIGVDRDHSRYWVFPNSTPALYVEKGWASKDISYRPGSKEAESSSSDSDASSSSEESEAEEESRKKRKKKEYKEKTIPHTGQNLWFMYDAVQDVDTLINNLHPLGIRESVLKPELQKQSQLIKGRIQALTKAKEVKDEPEDLVETNLKEGFREELIDMEMRLRNGGLGGVPDFDTWEKRAETASTIQEFGALLKESHSHVLEKFLKDMLIKKVKNPKRAAEKKEQEKEENTKEKDEESDEDSDEEDKPSDMINIGAVKWTESVDTCPTWSRLHVLMGILDGCVKWEKSAENAKCKICRKKGDEDGLLLCDECNQAFHLYCLRPALPEVPKGDWFCAACIPLSQRRASRDKNYRILAGETSEEEEESEVAERETECAVCGGEGSQVVVGCSSCPSVFHLDCHEPPLRHTPRSTWKCMQCKSGVRIRKSKRDTGKRATRRKQYKEEESDSDYEGPKSTRSRPKTQKAAKSRKTTSSRTRAPKTPSDGSSRRSSPEQQVRVSSRGRVIKTRRSSLDKSDDASEQLDEQMKVVAIIIDRLKRQRHSWPYLEPVDFAQVPDYLEVVKCPMDLQTIEEKCLGNNYPTQQYFVDDIALMFNNAMLYNKVDSPVGKTVYHVEKCFKDLLLKYLPNCTYSRDPSLHQEKREQEEEESSEDEVGEDEEEDEDIEGEEEADGEELEEDDDEEEDGEEEMEDGEEEIEEDDGEDEIEEEGEDGEDDHSDAEVEEDEGEEEVDEGEEAGEEELEEGEEDYEDMEDEMGEDGVEYDEEDGEEQDGVEEDSEEAEDFDEDEEGAEEDTYGEDNDEESGSDEDFSEDADDEAQRRHLLLQTL